MYGTRDDNALRYRRRHGVERHERARLLVQHHDVALTPDHLELLGAHHMRDVRGAVARGIDQVAAAHIADGRRQRKARVVARARDFNRFHRRGPHKRHPVGHGVLQRGDGDFKRVDKPGRGTPQGARGIGTGARLQLVDAFGANNRQLGHTVDMAIAPQLLQMRAVLVAKAQHHRPGAAEQKAQLLGPRAVKLATSGIDLCLNGARRRIVASVYQAAVGHRRAQRNIVSRLDRANGQVKPRELPCDGASGDARADNRDIKRFCHSASKTS